MAFLALEKLHRLHDGFFATYRVRQLDILLAQIDGKLYAYRNFCPHQGAPFHHDSQCGNSAAVRCPLHGLEYSLIDGSPINGNTGPLESVELIYEGNLVGVFVPEKPL